MIDSHCHLDDPRFDHDRSSVIARAEQAGVDRYIVAAIHPASCKRLYHLQQHYPQTIYAAYGLHPWFCEQYHDDDLIQLQTYLQHAIAVGECGLDFARSKNLPPKQQYYWLHAQLELAKSLQLPVILHACRSLDTLLIEIRKRPTLRGMIHGFNGSIEQAMQWIDAGFYLGIGTAITRPNMHRLQRVVRQLPLERIVIETDAPDQPPYRLQKDTDHRQMRNEPAFLVEVADHLAKLRDIPLQTVSKQCQTNTERLFAL